MVIPPPGLAKLCREREVSPAEMSLGWKALSAKAIATKCRSGHIAGHIGFS